MHPSVMVNGLPGKMARIAAIAIQNSDLFTIYPYSLSGNRPKLSSIEISGKRVNLCDPTHKISAMYGGIVQLALDYTKPHAIEQNVDFYCENEISFVMGTSGVNQESLESRVRKSKICAVIAPNTALPIVGLQEIISNYSQKFPGILVGKGYSLDITESHQSSKEDTSATAKKIVTYFKDLGIELSEKGITKIRSIPKQLKIGVPEKFLNAHGWHTYEISIPEKTISLVGDLIFDILEFIESPLFKGYNRKSQVTELITSISSTSPDGNFFISAEHDCNARIAKIVHNVNGREIYAPGAIESLKFLKRRKLERMQGKIYTTIDVLKENRSISA